MKQGWGLAHICEYVRILELEGSVSKVLELEGSVSKVLELEGCL